MSPDFSEARGSRDRFLQIVDELRAALGYPAREDDPEPGDELAMEMMYGNFDFAVVHSLLHSTGSVLIECDFGEIPAGRESAILMRLLEMNTALAELDGSVFCFDDQTDHLIYTRRIDLDALDGHRLLGVMTEIVWHGRRWLETRYMNDSAESGGALLNPVQLA